jgi:hypothetical protein
MFLALMCIHFRVPTHPAHLLQYPHHPLRHQLLDVLLIGRLATTRSIVIAQVDVIAWLLTTVQVDEDTVQHPATIQLNAPTQLIAPALLNTATCLNIAPRSNPMYIDLLHSLTPRSPANHPNTSPILGPSNGDRARGSQPNQGTQLNQRARSPPSSRTPLNSPTEVVDVQVQTQKTRRIRVSSTYPLLLQATSRARATAP